jgi:hypothetical protein
MNSVLDSAPAVIAGARVVHALAEIFDGRLDARAVPRKSYFGAVTVCLCGAPDPKLSAFARDISPLGIGLVHTRPIESGEVIVTLDLPSGGSVRLRTEIIWCKSFGDGWYASGGRFIDVLPPDLIVVNDPS